MFIDMSNFEDKAFNYIDAEGDFVVLSEGVVGDSSKVKDFNGTPYIDVRFKTKEGNTLKERFYITEKATWRIGALLSAMGVDSDTIRTISTPDEIDKAIKNKTLIITTKFESGAVDPVTREAKQYLRVSKFKKVS